MSSCGGARSWESWRRAGSGASEVEMYLDAPPPHSMPGVAIAAHLFGEPMSAESPALHDPGAATASGGGLLVTRAETRERLRRLVHRYTTDPNLQEDLLQEVLFCHWEAEVKHPGQTAWWYEQRCRFWLQDYFKKGRSVDSPKHAGLGCSLDELGAPELAAEGDIFEEICVRDELEVLAARLGPAEQRTLRGFCEDLTVRENARESHVCQATVIRNHHHIAAIALCLGIGHELLAA